ncbi:glycosyltransferase family 4 protein [Singulisphaera acidiphila]|uniref:Glycosyltransferase n=1 Tax=Singulisphaera acidiphila (strain ATCC BAA-1392 / DSM 18658 / VKM B-2454 / MOB10) TaxID=886293 RepID=L0D9J0_SINAD|nr:glycosyltransferase family 4 protein [Singulisphaera acidiphila]AGA25887.1 glycosyltransferase [Singulisphaera acidiphila DSM 18658]
MKILALSNLYPPDFIGGYELACADVVDALRDRGHDVRVLTAAPRLPVASPAHVLRRLKLIDEWSENGMGMSPFAFRRDEAESRLVSAYNVHALTTVLDEFQPDVVYVCAITGLGGFGLMACLQFLDIPWVWQLGDRVPHHLCSTRQRVIPGLAEAFSQHIRGHFIVVSDQLRREIEVGGIRLQGHVETIPNWITGTCGENRRDFYRGGHLRIMTAGQVARWKGTDVLIEAAARLRDAGHDDFSVHIYGKVHQPDLASMIHSLHLSNHVILQGVLPHALLLEAYRDYDLFAFPTLEREPFGLVPLEAVARGCVPIISRRCGIAEWLVHGVHCLKAERTPESFARVFAEVIERRIDLQPLARRGATAAWRDFHLDAILPRIERLLVRASSQAKGIAGSSHDAYRLARMAEQLTASLLEETIAA